MDHPELLSDETLLAAIGRGDSDAYEVFFQRHCARVYGFAVTVLRDPHLARDVAQETFLRVWRFAGGFDGRRGSATGWLLTITRNLSVDANLTHGNTLPTDPQTVADLLGPDPSPGPADIAAGADDVRRVREALTALPPEQLRAVLMARWYGQSAVDIAQVEGVPVTTIRSRLRAALRSLQRNLAHTPERP
jgi:RNA polymerase sigma factor (sigma-70 family)